MFTPLKGLQKILLPASTGGITYTHAGAATTAVDIPVVRPLGATWLVGKLEGVPNGTAEYWNLLPDAETATCKGNLESYFRGANPTGGARDAAGLLVATMDTNVTRVDGDFKLDVSDSPLAGFRRFYSEFVSVITSDSTTPRSGRTSMYWSRAANISSVNLRFNTSAANGLGTGTRITLWWSFD